MNGEVAFAIFVDRWARFAVTGALPDKSAVPWAKFINDKVYRAFSCILQDLTSDHGGEFENALMAELADVYDINIRMGRVRHPQTNGQVCSLVSLSPFSLSLLPPPR